MANDILDGATQITVAWIQLNPEGRVPKSGEVVEVFNAVCDAVRVKVTGR